jgi:hypothetical protein
LLSVAQGDLTSMPASSLELILARIWILKEMSLISQEVIFSNHSSFRCSKALQECLALQDLARDQDSLIASVFIIYGGSDVEERTLATKLLEAAVPYRLGFFVDLTETWCR